MEFYGFRCKTHRYIFLSSLFLNLVLQVKASSKALIVRVHLGFVCGTCNVTEYICKEHVYNKDRRKATSESNILSISFSFSSLCHHHDLPTLTKKNFARRLRKNVERERTPRGRAGEDPRNRWRLNSRHTYPKRARTTLIIII